MNVIQFLLHHLVIGQLYGMIFILPKAILLVLLALFRQLLKHPQKPLLSTLFAILLYRPHNMH